MDGDVLFLGPQDDGLQGLGRRVENDAQPVGLGLELALQGVECLLVDKADFVAGASSKSSRRRFTRPSFGWGAWP